MVVGRWMMTMIVLWCEQFMLLFICIALHPLVRWQLRLMCCVQILILHQLCTRVNDPDEGHQRHHHTINSTPTIPSTKTIVAPVIPTDNNTWNLRTELATAPSRECHSHPSSSITASVQNSNLVLHQFNCQQMLFACSVILLVFH